MVCYPEAQKKAQAELDEVLNGRLIETLSFLLQIPERLGQYKFFLYVFCHSLTFFGPRNRDSVQFESIQSEF